MPQEVPLTPATFPAQNAPPSQEVGASPAPGGGVSNVGAEKAQALAAMVQQMLARMQPRRSLAPPSPGPGYGPQDRQQGDFIMQPAGSNKGEIGFALYNVGTAVKNSIAGSKEKQLQTAMGDWNTLQQRWDNALSVAGGDEQKAQQIFEADPYTQSVLSDPKKMKNIAKAFSTDLLHPEKSTVYSEALSRHLKVNQAKSKMEGLKKILTLGMAGRNQQPQLSPEQKAQMTREMASKLPFTHTTPDPTKAAEFLEKQREFDIRSQEANARIQDMGVRTAELISHNKAQLRLAEERIADAKLAAEDRAAARRDAAGLRQQAQELRELQVMMQAGKD